MAGWWSADSAKVATRFAKRIASAKSLKTYCLVISIPPLSVHPGSVASAAWICSAVNRSGIRRRGFSPNQRCRDREPQQGPHHPQREADRDLDPIGDDHLRPDEDE